MIRNGCIDAKNTMAIFFKILPIIALGVFLACTVLSSNNACAASTPDGGTDNCTANPDGSDTPRFAIDDIDPANIGELLQKGLITSVVDKIKEKLMGTTLAGVQVTDGVAKKLFQSIVQDSGFVGALRAGMTLFIAIYGILFMAGIAEIKFNDLIIMFAKFAVVGALLSDTSWDFFNSVVVRFFNDGTDDLINKITAIAVGQSTPIIGSAGAFGAIDSALSKAISSKMLVTLMAALPANLYGIVFALLLLIALALFLKAMITATWVYVMSMAMKTLLFGLAPIFIPCILFKRTEHLFHGWLGQVIGASIQPVLLFVFLSFFVILMDAAMVSVMQTPVCWSKVPEGLRGSPFQIFFWRFMQRDSSGHWVPREGVLDNTSFPIDLVAILTFLILAYLANSFNTIVVQISNALSSSIDLRAGNPVEGMLKSVGGMLGGKK